MSGKKGKIIVGVLVIVIGLPVALILTALACCSIMDKTNGGMVSSGVTRRYLLYVPKTYDRSRPAPLVISIHPGATWPAVQRSISLWNDLADQYGFLVVYPEGTAPFSVDSAPVHQIWPMGPISLGRDVRFVADLIDKLEADYNIDPARIYANGMSNGGGMAFALSCKLSDRIAAIGAVAAAQSLEWERCGDSRPVPTVAFHGTADKLAPYLGGSSPIAPGTFPNIPDWTARVSRRNQCQGDPTDTRISPSVRRLAYTSCADNADVILYTVEGGGHTWPGGKHLSESIAGRTTDDVNASRVMWDFFVQHPLAAK
jgi:polyhydroxybutyrate depolymerase